MAELVAGFGVPHTPLLWELIDDDPPSDLVAVQDGFEQVRASLERIAPDVVVLVGSDHFHEHSHRSMPAFSIGKASRIPGTHPNEVRSFGLPEITVAGHPALAAELLGRTELAGGFDFAFSDAPHLDHAFVVPLLYLTPRLDLPVVPVHTNTNAPPLPPATRFVALGRHLATTIEAMNADLRVVIIATGHLAYELGGPRQFLGGSTDPAFDAEAVELIGSGDADGAARFATYDRLLAAGNVTFQFLNFLTLAAAMARPATSARGIECRFGAEPFFTWEQA